MPSHDAAAAAPAPLLEISGLRSAYGRIEVLHGIDLVVHAGEVVTLVGGNGAGKTTLLRAISGVQPVSAGRIAFAGEPLDRVPAHERVKRGIVQCPEGRQVFGPLSVEDNLRLGAWSRRRETSDDDLESVYARFPVLKDKRRLAAGGLSGGQQQMLAIGRALMARPKMLLLDEPSMGLAPLLVDEVFAVVSALREQGLTILLVEQNAVAALSVADRGYAIATGRIAAQGKASDLLDDPEVKRAYLGI